MGRHHAAGHARVVFARHDLVVLYLEVGEGLHVVVLLERVPVPLYQVAHERGAAIGGDKVYHLDDG